MHDGFKRACLNFHGVQPKVYSLFYAEHITGLENEESDAVATSLSVVQGYWTRYPPNKKQIP